MNFAKPLKRKPTVDTVGFVGYSYSNAVIYRSAAANSGIIIDSTKIPATIDAISFFVFLLVFGSIVAHKSLIKSRYENEFYFPIVEFLEIQYVKYEPDFIGCSRCW